MGSEDIRKQLPQETKMFEGVNDSFIACTLEMHVSSISPRTFSFTSRRRLSALNSIWIRPSRVKVLGYLNIVKVQLTQFL